VGPEGTVTPEAPRGTAAPGVEAAPGTATAPDAPGPSGRSAPKSSPLDLGPWGRVAFAALWIGLQAALILSAGGRADHIFGFRMFPEASTIEIRLWRETALGAVRAPQGEWSARDAAGQLRHFSWRDRVRDPILASIDTRVFASYGVDAQLARLGLALDDVALHIPEDAETRRLRAEVLVRRNGRDPEALTLRSRSRSSVGDAAHGAAE
jgi:hypothetical protein